MLVAVFREGRAEELEKLVLVQLLNEGGKITIFRHLQELFACTFFFGLQKASSFVFQRGFCVFLEVEACSHLKAYSA